MLTTSIASYKIASNRFRQQPQCAVEIDWSHPLARGLVFFQIPSMQAAHDLVGGATPTVLGTTTLEGGTSGRAITSNSAGTDGWVTRYKSDLVRTITTDFTVATKVDITAIATSSKIFSMPLGTTWTTPFASIQLGRSSTTSQIMLSCAPPTGTTLLNALYAAGTFQVSNGNSYVLTRAGTTAQMLYNKSWMTPTTNTMTTDPVQYGTPTDIALMNRMQPSPGEGTAGRMYYAALWNRALTEAEARDFDNNPYQILKPIERRATFAFDWHANTATATATIPKFGSTATGQRQLPGWLGTSASTLPKFTALASGTGGTPARTATSTSTLPRFTALAAATRTIPNRVASSAATMPKFTTRVTAAVLGPGFSASATGTLPKFTASAAATVALPARTAASASTLPKFTSLAAGARSVEAAIAAVVGTMPKFRSTGILLRGGIDRDGISASAMPKFQSTLAGTRTIPPNATISAAILPRFGSLAAATRTIPARIGVSNSGMPRLRSSTGAVSLPPAGTVVPVTVNHRRAPSWRLADAGTGQSRLSFGSPLDPNGLTYFTIDWATELNGSSDTIWLHKDAISVTLTPSSVVAGLMIHAITFDEISVTVWLKIQADEQSATQWVAGESYEMNFSVKTMAGQIFNRGVTVSIKQM